jgi:hypothetical protein
MEALYDPMASLIAQNSNAGEKSLTTAILQCVTCSLRVLTVAELSQALNEDTSKILDFQRSIVNLCGGFVVIDNGGNVAMIHQTAREYLLDGRSDRPFHVEGDAANAQMFLSCMRSLMVVGLRAKIQRHQQPDFLDYAATCWSKHLVATPIDYTPAVEVLNKFLNGPWVLTWIHYLSSTKQLRVLVQVSKHLSRHFARQGEYHATQIEQDSTQLVKQGLLEGWAVDLVRIVGKFGTILRRNPESIYKLVPPFCPQNSSIYQIFGNAEAKSLSVSGFSSDNWDDSLARISLGFGTFTSSITAAGGQIAILASSGSVTSVFIYDSSSFEEVPVSPIKHGERVYRMELNSTGTLLATYGYRKTKVWEVSTGLCKMSVENLENGPRPLAMLFANNNTKLLVGTDDRCVRSLVLTEECPAWQTVAELEEEEIEGHFLNSSSYMALSRDGSLIAVAYRGHPLSAWEIEGPIHIGHCWRKREEVTCGQVIDAVWNPHYPEVLGLYIEGVLFRWRPYDGEREEIAAGASQLTISRDGNLIATGDVRGTVKIYTTADLGLLYQLASEDTVFGLAFSPDLHRVYDIRGYYGNAWEPNALMKFVEQRGKGLDTGSETESLAQSSTKSIMPRSGRIDSVTVLAASPVGRLYSYGTDKGTVLLYDTRCRKLTYLYTAKNFLSIEHMSWSDDGRYLCFSDSGKRVIIMSVKVPNSAGGRSSDPPVVETEAEILVKMQSANVTISQLLFHPDSSQLAVYSSSTIQTISLSSFTVANSVALRTAVECKWITHPHDIGLMMGVAPSSIQVLDWDLIERQTHHFKHPQPLEHQCTVPFSQSQSSSSEPPDTSSPSSTPDLREAIVDRVVMTQGRRKLMLVQISLRGPSSWGKVFLCFDPLWFSASPLPPPTSASPGSIIATTEITDPTTTIETTLHPTHFLPLDVSNDIALALIFLPHDRLVFLSRTFSICTWQISPGSFSSGARLSSLLPSCSQLATPPPLPSDASPTNTIYATNSTLLTKDSPNKYTKSNASLSGSALSAFAAGTKPTKSTTTTTTTKPLFYLPGDWIIRDCLALCALWTVEKSLLCPRNGEVAVVRCTALA